MVVREDLAMGMGKLAAQVAHAAVMGAERTKQSNEILNGFMHGLKQVRQKSL